MFEAVFRDIHSAVRWLRRSPGFAAVAVLSLGLGIGLNSAIFAVVDALLLRPLPVADPARLVDVYSSGGGEIGFSTHSVPDFEDYRTQNTVFEDLAGYSMMFAAVGRERPRLTLGESVTGNYFQMLGVRATLGRTLEPGDAAPGAPRVVVLSDRYWRRELGADPAAIGRTLFLRSQPYAIVGVIDRRFTGMVPLLAAEIWTTTRYVEDVEPAGINEVVPSPGGTSRLDRRGTRWIFVKGRLRPVASVEQARANLDAIAARLREAHPETNRDRQVRVRPAADTRLHPDVDGVLTWMLAGTMIAVGLVLAIACANVAGMLLARASSRYREIAIRLAIGASRSRLVRQLLTESVLLGAIGAMVGLTLASWMTRLLATFELPIPIPISLDLRIDLRVLAFTTAVALLTGVLAGLAPAVRLSRLSLIADLKDASSHVRTRRLGWTMRDLLVIGQMAVTLVLLVSAALLVRSLLASRHADVGFQTGGLAIVSGDAAMAGYDADRSREFWKEADRRVRALPGVQAVAFASRVPFSINFNRSTIAVPGHVKGPAEDGVALSSADVSPGYFAVLGVPVVRGREFGPADLSDGPRVAIVSEAAARRFWPGEPALGKMVFERTLNSGRSFEIVGVVADHKLQTVGETTQPAIFFTTTQRPDSYNVMVARTSGDASALVRDMGRVLLDLEPAMPLFERQTMDTQISATLLPLRVGVVLLAVFSALGLLLAAIGLYGVIAFAVARRTREIGIRVAIGARPASVLALVARQGFALAAIGLLVGSLLASGAARVVSAALYGVGPADPIAWIGAVVALLAITGIANLLPAFRATQIDPVTALRSE
jgi:predicted permease